MNLAITTKRIPIHVRQWSERSPIVFKLICAYLCYAMIVGMCVGYRFWQHSTERSSVISLREGTPAQLQKALDTGTLAEIRHHRLDVGTGAEQLLLVNEYVLRDGTHFRLRANQTTNTSPTGMALFDYTQSHLVPQIDGVTQGDYAITSLVDSLSFITQMAALMIAMIVAQRAVADNLSSRSFGIVHEHSAPPTIDSIVGYPAVKKAMLDAIEILMHRKEYAEKGITPPQGLMLVGPPGVGKTMWGKVVAGQMNRAFLYCSAADFSDMFVGAGPRRARNLFAEARRRAPCVIFIDEIDALGNRSDPLAGSERTALINQMLTELDGVNSNEGVLVIGATNHLTRVDPAILRSGRFDQIIEIPLPDLGTRVAMLRKMSLNPAGQEHAHIPEHDYEALALRFAGMSGADISTMTNDAKIIAARSGKPVHHDHFAQAHETRVTGLVDRTPTVDEEHRVRVHELGHALLLLLKQKHMRLVAVSVGGKGSTLGYTLQVPDHEKNLSTRDQKSGTLAFLLGGRAAEEIYFGGPGEVSDGARGDLSQASALAIDMVENLGMGPKGHLLVPPRKAGQPAADVLQEARELLDTQYEQAKATILAHSAWFDYCLPILKEHRRMSGPDLKAALVKLPSTQLDRS